MKYHRLNHQHQTNEDGSTLIDWLEEPKSSFVTSDIYNDITALKTEKIKRHEYKILTFFSSEFVVRCDERT